MSILDLDEAQGLTAEMVRKHIAGLGYAMQKCPEFPVCKSLGRHTHQGGVKGVDFAIADAWEGNERAMRMLDCSLNLLASIVGLSLQSLLREINPRMRAGLPSAEARRAHSKAGGLWLGCYGELGNGGWCGVYSFDDHVDWPLIEWSTEDEWHRVEQRREELSDWLFWPCDAHLNKVRWPERDGVML